MKAWTKLVTLAPGEVRLLVEATIAVIAADLALRLLPVQSLLRSVQLTRAPAETPIAEKLAQYVDIADRHVPGTSSCLRRAMALYHLFRLRGIDATLRLGVRKERQAVHGHAWVETKSGVFGLADGEVYAPLSQGHHQ